MIVDIHHPEVRKDNPVISLAFSGILILLFFAFAWYSWPVGFSLGAIPGAGYLFLATYLTILAIIVLFWIGGIGSLKLNLINTLFALTLLFPLTLYALDVGLCPQRCQVGPG